MAWFANALVSDRRDAIAHALCWLAGLLEAEGTFLKPPPSGPSYPIVVCRMTDRDIVERVAAMFGTSVRVIDKGRYRSEYAAVLKGSRAVSLMRMLRPMMGSRRQAAINRALEGYTPPARKLSFSSAEEIRRRYATGESVSSLARSFGVARQTIHAVLQHRIYREPERLPWRAPTSYRPTIVSPLPGSLVAELFWLAGWLEGEGSFCAPPPSDPRRPRIAGQCNDHDVIAEVARLLGVKPLRSHDKRARANGWAPTWRVLLAGQRAIRLMQALDPLMGARRTRQIEAALSAGEQAKRARSAAVA